MGCKIVLHPLWVVAVQDPCILGLDFMQWMGHQMDLERGAKIAPPPSGGWIYLLYPVPTDNSSGGAITSTHPVFLITVYRPSPPTGPSSTLPSPPHSLMSILMPLPTHMPTHGTAIHEHTPCQMSI